MTTTYQKAREDALIVAHLALQCRFFRHRTADALKHLKAANAKKRAARRAVHG